jgi:hypothetical protein
MAVLCALTVASLLSASAGAGSVSGRVMSSEGRPIAGAEVALYALEGSEERAARLDTVRPFSLPLPGSRSPSS